MSGKRIAGFEEKGRSGPGWINAGAYVIGKDFSGRRRCLKNSRLSPISWRGTSPALFPPPMKCMDSFSTSACRRTLTARRLNSPCFDRSCQGEAQCVVEVAIRA